MDAFLTSNRPVVAGQGEFEAAYDVLNGSMDVFDVRKNDRVGDYHGVHVHAGIAVTPRLWVDGGYWQRKIDYRGDMPTVNSWKVGTQYRVWGEDSKKLSFAIRGSLWGNYADDLTKSTSTSLQGIRFDTVSVNSPKDIQYQFDLIGTWPAGKDVELTMFVGGGKSKVTVGAVSATTRRDGCDYNLSFGRNEVVGTLAQPCGNGAIERFSIPNDQFGVHVNREAEYDATYLQAGISAKWKINKWHLRAGYHYQDIRRDHIDEIIASRRGITYETNHILLGEVAYRVARNALIMLRGQYMENQFTGEIPFAYNSVTARRFGQHYGFISTGLIVDF